MKALLALIKKLYGSKALSKTIGTRTNVITLPDKETKRFISNELNIDAASDAAVKKAYEDVEKLIPDIPKMNDQEILTLTGNLRRLDNRLNPPSAEVIGIGTKQPVSKEGIKSLTEQAGQMSPPGTLMGNLESRLNQLRASGKELEDITKGKGMSFEDLIKDPTRSGGPLDPKVGIVRTAAREILEKNLKAGKIDIPDPAAKDAILKSYQGGTDPIDVIRQTYGESILEQLDDIADELNKAGDYKEIQKILQREKLFDVKPKKTYGYDEGVYSDEEMAKIISADSDEGKKITEALIGKPKAKVTELVTAEKIIADMNKMDPMDAMYEANKVLKKEGKYKNLKEEDVQKIMSKTEDNIFQRNIPEEPEEFAIGGRVGKAQGGLSVYDRYQELLNEISNQNEKNIIYPTTIYQQLDSGSDSAPAFTTPTKEKSEATLTEGITDVGENKFRGVGSMVMGGILSALNPVLGAAYSLSDPNSITRQALASIGYNPVTEGSINGPFGGYNGFTGTEGTFSTNTSDTGASGGQAASEAGMSEGMSDLAEGGRVGFQKGTPAIFNQLEMDVPYPHGHRVEMASGGITALKALLKFFAEQRGKKGSDMLKEINPKRLGFLQNMLRKSDKDMLDANRQEYLEDLSEIIKSDKKLLDTIKEMPADQQATFFKSANEGGNKGRLSVYKDPNFNIEDAIGEIEQMKKNLKFKDVPEKEVKRQMNASGGVAYLMGL